MAESPEAQIVRLQVQLEAMERSQKERHEDDKRSQKERHEDNRSLLEQILQQARVTNGRLTTVELWKERIDQRVKDWDDGLADIGRLRSESDLAKGRRGAFAALFAVLGGILTGLVHWGLQKIWR